MFSYHSIDEEHQQENDTVQLNNSVQQGQKIERRRISTVGNFYNFANSLTSTDTTTPIIKEKPSNHSGYNKSVVTSVSMSLERKDSIEYTVNPFSKINSGSPRGLHPSCIIPPGQNTVIHFDNYTKFMAQRVTTTRTDLNTSAEISKELPTTTTSTTNHQLGGEVKNDYHSTQLPSTSISGNSALDIDVQVIFGGSSKNLINKKTLTMHKQKMMASKSINTPSRIRNRKESLALDSYIMPPPTPSDKTIKNSEKAKTDSLNKPKTLLKKPRRTRQKKIKDPKATANKKQTNQAKAEKQALAAEESLVPQMSRFTQTDELPKILKPCVNLLHDKKCPQQLTCQYLHSDFPCKYYYYSLPCPDGTACRFMHNGPLSAELKIALQNHLVDLLSGGGKSPSETESLFIQQMQNIEDLSLKLKEFQNKAITTTEVIELMDDDDDDDGDRVLVIDESAVEIKTNDFHKTVIPSLNPLQNTQHTQLDTIQPKTTWSLNTLQNTQQTQMETLQANTPLSLNPLQNTQPPQQVLALVPTRNPRNHKLDTEFKIFKKVNTVLGNIEDNLENLKKSNMTAEEKNKQLIDIYEQLINQDKLLPQKPITIEENDKNNTEEPLLVYKTPVEQTTDQEAEPQPHIILLDPEIVHDIQTTTNSQDSLIILTDEDDYSEEATALKVELRPNDHKDLVGATEKLAQSDAKVKNDNTLSLENVKSFENQETQQFYSNLLENRANISTTIKKMMDENNMTIWKISTTKDSRPSGTNIKETTSNPLLPEQQITNNNSTLNNEESQQDYEENLLTTKIPNIPKENEENSEILTASSSTKQNEQIENNSLNLDTEKDLQYNCENISNNLTVPHEDITESTCEIAKYQPIVELIDDDSSTSLDNEEQPQPTNGAIASINNSKHNSILLDEQNKESTNILQQQPKIDDTAKNNSILLDEQNTESNNNLPPPPPQLDNTEHLKNISQANISNPPGEDINEINTDYTKPSTSVVNTKAQLTNETITEISNSIDDFSSTQQTPDKIDRKKELQQTNSDSPGDETSTLELAISSDEKDIIEGNDDDESPPFEQITSTSKSAPRAIPKTFPRAIPRSRIRLRSHTVHDNEETDFKSSSQESEISTTIEAQIKPFKKFRRLRLPKPTTKAIEKSLSNECKIDAEIINKLIDVSNEKPAALEDLEVPLTQNVIITNRFLKKAKAKLNQQDGQHVENVTETLENTEKTTCDNKNVELNMFAMHNENFELTICTQTSSDGSQSLTLSQDPLMDENNLHDKEISNDAIDTFLKCHEDVETNNSTSLPSPKKIKKTIQLKRRISFENASSPSLAAGTSASAPAPAKQQFILGNPHVVLTKLKPALLPAISTQKQMQADSTTSNANNSIVVSSSTNSPISTATITICSSSNSVTLLTADKSSQALGRKRRSFTPESDMDSSLKADKVLKVANTKSARKVNLRRERSSVEPNSDKDDFNTDSSDEKPTKGDALQSSSSSSTDNERAFKPTTTSTGQHVTTQQQNHLQHNVHLDEQQQKQHENESDLRQQIENVSNKSDLQLQSQSQQQQNHQLQTQKEIETTTITSIENHNDLNQQQQHQEQEQQQKQIEKDKIANTCNPFDDNTQIAAVVDNDKTQQLQTSPTLPPQHIVVNVAKPTSILSNKYPNEAPISPGIFEENTKGVEETTDLFKYSSLYNKLSAHTARRQINFENSSVNITPIASPTYVGGDNTIASPSPVRGDTFDIRLGGEIDGRMTYPPMRYILRRIDVGKNEINKPACIDKLAKTTQLDPRIFRSHVKPISQTSQAAGPTKYSTTNSALSASYQTTSMLPYDPRNRSTSALSTPPTPPSNQTALSCCNMNSTTELVPIAELQTPAVGVPLQHQHSHHQHHHHQVHHQIPAQQTPNMLLYGCLQRSPWYQSLMSTMKIQINQSISQLVRALNNFQRERLLNPNIVFDIFKIDIAAELLEIMRNLGIFVDANGIINEQRHVPTYAGRSCLGVPATAATIPVNATYSFIQQVLTPTTLGASMMTTASSSTYNAGGGGALNVNEPFVSCYIEAPKIVQLKQHHEEIKVPPQDDNSNHNNGSGDSYNSYNQRRSNNEFKKPYDNNSQQNSQQQRGSYNQNPRFNRSYQNSESTSPTRTSPQHLSPRGGGGGGSRGGGRGGRYNNNNNNGNPRRFNNNNNNNGNYGASRSSSSPPPQGNSFNNRNNRSFNSNNSPTKTSSSPPSQNYGQYRNSCSNRNNSSSPPPSASSSSFQQKSPPTLSAKPATNDEEDWD